MADRQRCRHRHQHLPRQISLGVPCPTDAGRPTAGIKGRVPHIPEGCGNKNAHISQRENGALLRVNHHISYSRRGNRFPSNSDLID